MFPGAPLFGLYSQTGPSGFVERVVFLDTVTFMENGPMAAMISIARAIVKLYRIIDNDSFFP